MSEETQRDIKSESYARGSESDSVDILPLLALDLQSSNKNLHIPALSRVLNIVLKGPECLDEFYNMKIPSALQTFLGPNEQGEKYVLSTTILHIVGVYDKATDDVVRATAAIEPLIQIIHSPNEGRSSSACAILMNLIDDDIIRASLLQTGFLGIVHHALTSKPEEQKKSSSSSEDGTIPNHVKLGLLEIVLKLAEEEEGLEPLAVIIPVLDELKSKGQGKIKSKAKKILDLLNGEGIAASSQSEKEKIDRIRELEETVHRQEDELRKEKEEIVKLKEENEKLKPKPTQDLAIAIINPDTGDYFTTPEANGQLKICKRQDKYNTVSLSQVLENGVYAIEAEFSNTLGNGILGIVRDSFQIPAGIYPHQAGYNQHMATYHGTGWGANNIYYKGAITQGNTQFAEKQIVKAEYDSEKGTLIFFLAETQQPVYISGIKEKICMYYADSYCIIRSLKKLSAPTSGHVDNEKAVQW
ncbi:MAG: hypothetical protein EZS28_006733 [Streblomastix strix]|uniref:SPRY domain-containing protein n=1 Tax=Streblomastix strix TaxID=222440 RepID=A0A5J4WRP4_9EUKA|nr:MAG: hypothetical protein EZS28_006733 [Streblomastix strix]